MNNVRRMGPIRATCLAGGAALLWSAGSALATEPAAHGTRPPPTREMREQMAKAHEQMAACLRSDRPIDECQAEKRKMHDAMKHEHAKMNHPEPESAQK